jgi:hypothetical protein
VGRAIGAGLAALVVTVLLLPSPAGLTAVVGVVLFVVVVWAWTDVIRRGVSASVELPGRLLHGEEAELAVTVENRSRLPASRVRVEV